MFKVSNDLYGNNIASAHELAKGYTRPVVFNQPKYLPQDIYEAQQELSAKRKLNVILSSKSIQDTPFKIGDTVQIYVKLQNQKRGSWCEPTSVLEYDPLSQTVTVAGAYGRRQKAAIEDTRHALSKNELAKEIQATIDSLSSDIENELEKDEFNTELLERRIRFSDHDDIIGDEPITAIEDANDQELVVDNGIHDDMHDQMHDDKAPEDEVQNQEKTAATEMAIDPISNDPLATVTYIPEQPSTFAPENIEQRSTDITKAHPTPSWKLLPVPSTHSMQTCHGGIKEADTHDSSEESIQADTIELLPGSELTSAEQPSLKLYYDEFKSKEFMLYQAEGLPSYITANAYGIEEENFIKQCICMNRCDVPDDANLIRSHVLYKIKTRDDGTFMWKARIAPHGNEDSEKDDLKRDSACFPPLGIRMLISLSVSFQWYLTKIDVKGAFLQSGNAQRDVYVIPPKECEDRHTVWLLTVATYGLVNANAKWQIYSDDTFQKLGLKTIVYIPRLFYLPINGIIHLIVVKVTDNIFLSGPEHIKQKFIKDLSKVYQLATITHLPGSCWFFGLEVTQTPDFKIQIHADEKLSSLSPYTISRFRRKQATDALNSVEQFHFNSINGSIGFIGTHAAPFGAYVSSYLKQKRNSATVKDISVQASLLKVLEQLGSIISYCVPSCGTHQISVVLFADASRPSVFGQLGFINGVLLGTLSNGSVYHILSWTSHLSRRPTKSIGAAEVLASGAALDEGILTTSALSILLGTKVDLVIVVGSKDLFTSLTTSHVPEDKSIQADVQLIRYYFETKRVDRIAWVPGRQNLADPFTKKESSLRDTLQLLLFEGTIPFDFSTEERISQHYLG